MTLIERFLLSDEMLDYEVEHELTRVKHPIPNGSRTLLRLHRAFHFILQGHVAPF